MLRGDAKTALLKKVPLFADCSKEELTLIADTAVEVEFPQGAAIINEGDETLEFYVVITGNADVLRRDKLLRTLGPGDFFGEIAILLGAPRSATVTTTSPVRVLVIDKPELSRLLREVKGLHRKVIRALGERLVPAAL